MADEAVQVQGVGILCCPETRLKLVLCRLKEAEDAVSGGKPLRALMAGSGSAFSPTPNVLLREDRKCAYPVVGCIPILLAPEMLAAEGTAARYDRSHLKYVEAYAEMTNYNEIARRQAVAIEDSATFRLLEPVLNEPVARRAGFPHPREIWLDATYECASQWDAYRHLAPVNGKRVLQIGGKGLHVVKFLLAGAEEGWLATPMLGEIQCAIALARTVGVSDRLRYVVAIGEELPFDTESFDAIYCGGCVHHMVTPIAFPECARVLRNGGRFAASEPWRAPFYTIGTRVFGKQEDGAHCHPLTKHRLEPLAAFRDSSVIHHGALTRYPLLALFKSGVSIQLSTAWRINRIDDALSSRIPFLRNSGSSIALLAEK